MHIYNITIPFLLLPSSAGPSIGHIPGLLTSCWTSRFRTFASGVEKPRQTDVKKSRCEKTHGFPKRNMNEHDLQMLSGFH